MKLSLLLLLVAFLAAAFSQDAPADCSVVLCPANTVCKSASFDCEGTVCPQVACVAAPKVLDPCVDAVCPQSTVCLPEPKQCVTTPCPQYRCLSMNEYVCATSICTESTRCVPSPKQCFTTPCPQYDCVPLDDSSSAPSDQCTQASCGTNQVCLSEPKQCFTTPCPQYACLNKAECPDFCPEVYQPVCGSNDKTYPNLCKLRAAMCLTKASIYVQHDGECTAEEECTTICPANYAPVCGSDGVTYSNQCSLGVRACQSKAQITVAHVGECSDCNIACTMEYAPVCGSDEHTYSNLCALKVAACKAKAALSVKYQGECQVAELPCPQFCPMNFAPVCGSDGITYSNICNMQVAACNLKATIEVSHDGECTAADSPCNAMCTEQYEPVCGSNLETFSNKCFFEVAKCRAKSNMFVLHAGQCREDVWDSVSLLDADGNGAVSLQEFASTHPEMTSAEINAAFSSSDRDKDGNLTPNDFSASAGSVGHGSNRPAVVVGVLAAFIGGIALAIAGYMYMKQQKRSRAQENLASSRNVGANNFSKEYEAFDDSL